MSTFFLPTSTVDTSSLAAKVTKQALDLSSLMSTVATNKTISDAAIAGQTWKAAVRLKTAGPLPAYNPTDTQPNRTYTATANGALTIDGVAVAAGDRVLLDQNITTPADGGIFDVVSAGSAGTTWQLKRSQDSNNDPTGEMVRGVSVSVLDGTTASGRQYILTSANPISLGTTALTWVQFSAGQVTMGGTDISGPSSNAVVNKINGAAADTAATNNTIAKRDGTGGLTATQFTAPTLTTATGQLTLQQTGGSVGPSKLQIVNQAGANGCIIDTTGSSSDLSDIQLKSSSGNANVRFEKRTANLTNSSNSALGELLFILNGSTSVASFGAVASSIPSSLTVTGNVTTPGTTNVGQVSLGSNGKIRGVVLYDNLTPSTTDHRFTGFGTDSTFFRSHIPNSSAMWGWFVGTGATTSTELMRLDSSGNLTTVGGIKLQTTGGTPTSLNYYEELSFNTAFTGPFTTGTLTFLITRVGKTVTFSTQSSTPTTTSTNTVGFVASALLPSRFLPSSVTTVYLPWMVTKANLPGAVGTMQISSAGTISIYAGAGGEPFIANSQCGLVPSSVSWNVM